MDQPEVDREVTDRLAESLLILIVGHLCETFSESIYITSQPSESAQLKAMNLAIHQVMPALLEQIAARGMNDADLDVAIAQAVQLGDEEMTHTSGLPTASLPMEDGFPGGYEQGVMASAQIATCLPFSEKWTEITAPLSEADVHALAWRTSMAILDLLPERMVKHKNGAV
ncbi:MAG: hypothetical protein ACYCYL_01325 [Acidithiobacillus sp.]